jgi:hypothetical protein
MVEGGNRQQVVRQRIELITLKPKTKLFKIPMDKPFKEKILNNK